MQGVALPRQTGNRLREFPPVPSGLEHQDGRVPCIASAQAVDFRCPTGGHKMLCPRGNPRLDAEGFSGILEAPDNSNVTSCLLSRK
jgi:hypothetical protein